MARVVRVFVSGFLVKRAVKVSLLINCYPWNKKKERGMLFSCHIVGPYEHCVGGTHRRIFVEVIKRSEEKPSAVSGRSKIWNIFWSWDLNGANRDPSYKVLCLKRIEPAMDIQINFVMKYVIVKISVYFCVNFFPKTRIRRWLEPVVVRKKIPNRCRLYFNYTILIKHKVKDTVVVFDCYNGPKHQCVTD
ncbi:hypothetical protein P5673_007641 [Acropora cervicornis]|uniref:Uncharacterized protein n=1 Tax=Acropora cervicornis TaxID=6130 RepID=A0AAD9QVD1_ACRCE|nr:hypothetical protein P5673_007641 [Acropora cervicornis]